MKKLFARPEKKINFKKQAAIRKQKIKKNEILNEGYTEICEPWRAVFEQALSRNTCDKCFKEKQPSNSSYFCSKAKLNDINRRLLK